MRAATGPFLASLGFVPVALPIDSRVDRRDNMFESELVVKESRKWCVSTMEAVMRALRLLEPEGKGEEIEEVMVLELSLAWYRLVRVCVSCVCARAERAMARCGAADEPGAGAMPARVGSGDTVGRACTCRGCDPCWLEW